MSLVVKLAPGERDVIQEAVAYMGRRFFDPRDSRILLEIEERLDEARRNGDVRLYLEVDQVGVLRRVFESYAATLDHPSTDAVNRRRIAQMATIDRRLGRATSPLGRLKRWLGLG